MTGAMTAAIAGLKTHMQKLNVIGNNIANVNTYGYKAQRAIFSEGLYSTVTGGSDGSNVVGGNNPSQIGYGVNVGAIGLNMTTGSYFSTGYATDCMIDGDGFFLVGGKDINIDPTDAETLKTLQLTRVGDFSFDSEGYLCDISGNVVYGFLTTNILNADGTYKVSDQLVPIRLPMMKVTTTTTTVADPNDPTQNITVEENTIEIKYPTSTVGGVVGGAGTKLTDVTDATKDLPATTPAQGSTSTYQRVSVDSIAIDPATGKITAIAKDTDAVITVGYIAIGNVSNPSGVTHISGPYYKAQDGAGDLTVTLMGGAEKALGISTVNGSLLDPNATAAEGMSIGSAGTTGLITGGLEMSLTDLATEMSEMITTQRGYQANTRIITVTDSMLEELVNIKR